MPFSRLDARIDKPFGNQFIINPKTLGEHIRRKRVKSNLFQKDVANTIGVSEDSITYWENNRAAPQIQFYPKIIDFLGYIPFEIDSNTFEGKIQLYRYLNGLSHKEMGKLLSVNATTIGAWETGKSKPNSKAKVVILERLKTI